MSTPPTRVRLGSVALATAGALFVLYPAVRPWTDETTADGALAAMSSGAWVASHLFAMLGFILLPLGLLAVRAVVAHTGAERLAFIATITTWIGAGLVLPYYGAEDFGLNAVANAVADGQQIDLVALSESFRYDAVAVTTFAGGLLALAVGPVLAAVAVWRSGALPRYCAVPLALGFALFLPQFFTPAAVRIGHGVLVAAGSIWLAAEVWRATKSQQATPTSV